MPHADETHDVKACQAKIRRLEEELADARRRIADTAMQLELVRAGTTTALRSLVGDRPDYLIAENVPDVVVDPHGASTDSASGPAVPRP